MPAGVELILLKQLASCLAIPLFVADREGGLAFFNESAEPLVGRRFEESGELTLEEWGDLLQLSDETGRRLDEDERPLVAALRRREPVHRRIYVRSLDGKRRELEATAIPLIAEDGEMLGALGLFWQPSTGDPSPPDVPTEKRRGIQNDVEVILMRRLASYLDTPIFLVGAEGQLLYFNTAAERILGRRFDEMMASTRDELYATFRPSLVDGSPLERGAHPLTIARQRREPAHLRFCNRIHGRIATIEGTAFPLIGQSGRVLGAAGVFWEIALA